MTAYPTSKKPKEAIQEVNPMKEKRKKLFEEVRRKRAKVYKNYINKLSQKEDY